MRALDWQRVPSYKPLSFGLMPVDLQQQLNLLVAANQRGQKRWSLIDLSKRGNLLRSKTPRRRSSGHTSLG